MDLTEITDWLLDGDPAIRWQTMQDLIGADLQMIAHEQERVGKTGWGASILSLQAEDGRWGGGLYGPKWISTHYSLMELRRLGLVQSHSQALKGAQVLMDAGFYADGGINFSSSVRQSEACITGMCLSLMAYFRLPDKRVESLADHLLKRQMPDGGWNCQDVRGATHSSFHTTISVLEGMRDFAGFREAVDQDLSQAAERGREFLLQHHLYRSHRTGEVVDARMSRFPFPPRWYYDVLRALDYFQSVDAPRDPRLVDAIELLKRKRRADGTWPAYAGYSGRVHFRYEKPGEPGRWNTLRALRVLKWWEHSV